MYAYKNKKVTKDEAVSKIVHGSTVLYPTETFYALGCNALDERAVQAIFTLKQRNLSHPLPIIVGSIEQVESTALDIDSLSLSLMGRFWPGPLTIILKAASFIPALVSAGTGKVAVRIPSHSAALELVKACGVPLVSSSANISGSLPATSVYDVSEKIVKNVDCIVTKGEKPAGDKPSTLVEVQKKKVFIHREGCIGAKQLYDAGFEVYPK